MKQLAGLALIVAGLALAFLALTSSTMNDGLYGAGIAIIVATAGLVLAVSGAAWVVRRP